jgi:hypothetical protein
MLFFTRFQPFKRVVKRVINGIYFFSGELPDRKYKFLFLLIRKYHFCIFIRTFNTNFVFLLTQYYKFVFLFTQKYNFVILLENTYIRNYKSIKKYKFVLSGWIKILSSFTWTYTWSIESINYSSSFYPIVSP